MSGPGGDVPGSGVAVKDRVLLQPFSMNSNPQLPLGLALKDSARFESYFPGQNGELVQHLQGAATGDGERLVYIAGPSGSCLYRRTVRYGQDSLVTGSLPQCQPGGA
jgi:hypothetical protein